MCVPSDERRRQEGGTIFDTTGPLAFVSAVVSTNPQAYVASVRTLYIYKGLDPCFPHVKRDRQTCTSTTTPPPLCQKRDTFRLSPPLSAFWRRKNDRPPAGAPFRDQGTLHVCPRIYPNVCPCFLRAADGVVLGAVSIPCLTPHADVAVAPGRRRPTTPAVREATTRINSDGTGRFVVAETAVLSKRPATSPHIAS